MSSISLVRPPAWPGLAPGLPEPCGLDPATAAAVGSACGLEGAIVGLRQAGVLLPLFRLERQGRPALFLKFVEPARAEAAARAEAVAAHLAAAGLRVPSPLPGFPRLLPDGRLAVALPWIDGRRLAPHAGDLLRLGRAMGSLHRVLAAHPDRRDWEAATARRMADLATIRAELAEGRLVAGPEPAAVRALAADPALDFAPEGETATPLHGDLNAGNVLVDRQDGGIVLLDFEDVFHSVLPPRFELMLAIQRHVLVPVADDTRAAALIGCLLAGYAETAGQGSAVRVERPVETLRALALRSLCVLALGAQAGLDGGAEEWGKFLSLEAQARERSGLLVRTCRAP